MFAFTYPSVLFEIEPLLYYAATFEAGLEMLTHIARRGGQPRNIYYQDLKAFKQNWVSLPAKVFDGQPFKEPIARLQREWEQVLRVVD